MRIYVETSSGKNFLLDVKSTDLVEKVKQKIPGVPPERQQLIYDDVTLDNKFPLSYYNISSDATLRLVAKFGGSNSKASSAADPKGDNGVDNEAIIRKMIQIRAIREKALQLLSQVDKNRGSDTDKFFEITISLCAVREMIEVDNSNKSAQTPEEQNDIEGSDDEEDGESNKNSKKKDDSSSKKRAPKSIRSYWAKWALDKYSFSDIVITNDDYANLSGAAREYIDSSNGTHIMQSLKYFFPAKPKKPGDKPKPLTNDQRVQNGIFVRLLMNKWKEAQEELEKRIKEYSARKASRDAAEADNRSESRPAEAKDDAKSESKGDSGSKHGADGAESVMSKFTLGSTVTVTTKAKMLACNEIGLKRLKLWAEEDEDKLNKEMEDDRKMKQVEAKQNYEQWVKHKSELRIRLPDNFGGESTPPMLYGGETASVKSSGGPTSTAILQSMAANGFKYIHATTRGKQGREGDFEKTRKQLLELGHVLPENFEAPATYRSAIQTNSVLVEKREVKKKVEDDNAKAFEEWVVLKEMREQALKCLAVLPKPVLKSERDMTMSASKLRSSTASTGSLRAKYNNFSQEEKDKVISIGRALKKVDRTLLGAWADWAKEMLTHNIASILWDSFPPIACDVHSPTNSQIRDAFMKVLRPGLDFRKTFTEYASKVNKNRASSDEGIPKEQVETLLMQLGAKKRDLNLEDLDSDSKTNLVTLDQYTQFIEFCQDRDRPFLNSLRPGVIHKLAFEEFQANYNRIKIMKEFKLSKDQFSKLLEELGVTLRGPELRILIDLFDQDKDGTITLQEFLDFVGPKREKNSGSSLVLSQRCCWNTTCKVTGMANAYAISVLKKRSKLLKDSRFESKAENDTTEAITDGSGKMEIIPWGKHEKRLKVELGERVRREDILRDFELLPHDNKADAKDSDAKMTADGKRDDNKRATHDETTYDDEGFDDEHGDDAKSEAKSESDGKKVEPCDFAKWSKEDRSTGLQDLLDISLEARQEATLRKLLTQGKPPKAPKLECTLPSEESQESNFITIKWAPYPDDLVSFYSLEFGGLATSKVSVYREIFKDPEDASQDCVFEYRMNGLVPGASYLFRIRGFNGFGPGEFTYKTFTTRTLAPQVPRAVKVGHDTVTLRWIFPDKFFKRLEELKRIFDAADIDKSGQVNRDELVAAIDGNSSSGELRVFLKKAAAGMGIDVSNGFQAMFDMIEGDDDGGLSWKEFEDFFMNAGWGSMSTLMPPNASVTSLASTSSTVLNAHKTSVTYIVERCASEFDNSFVEVLRTLSGEATINHLEPGQSYRFRVYSLNADKIPGSKSESIIVHTKLETPPIPSIAPRGLTSKKIVLTWKGRTAGLSTRNKGVEKKMVGDWAKSHNENDGGVSIEQAFAKYDVDASGSIDIKEFAFMLQDLGVETSADRLGYAFSLLDKNGDGTISFDEFSDWWRRDGVLYTVKRSEAIVPSITKTYETNSGQSSGVNPAIGPSLNASTSRPLSASRSRIGVLGTINEERSVDIRSQGTTRPQSARRGSQAAVSVHQSVAAGSVANNVKLTKHVAMPIVSYNGSDSNCEIGGLEPNRLYHFKLRYTGSRSYSLLSNPLVFMTLPLSPSKPALIETTATTCRIKWFAPEFGAFKFAVQCCSDAMSSNAVRQSATMYDMSVQGVHERIKDSIPAPDNWVTVFNGQETVWTSTTMTPDKSYSIRVFSINFQGGYSEPSEILNFTTPKRTDVLRESLGPRSVNTFDVECAGDIVVGDTILFTERLFSKEVVTPPANSNSLASTVASRKSLNSSTNRSSVQSLAQSIATEQRSVFLGERTVACVVVKDNFRSICAQMQDRNSDITDIKKITKQRRLWLEVVWQRNSSEACKPYDMKSGAIIEKMQSDLEQFEVFRSRWKQEESRIRLLDEYNKLKNCYFSVDM